MGAPKDRSGLGHNRISSWGVAERPHSKAPKKSCDCLLTRKSKKTVSENFRVISPSSLASTEKASAKQAQDDLKVGPSSCVFMKQV